ADAEESGRPPISAAAKSVQGMDERKGRRLLYVVNNPAFFLSHRLPIALAAKDSGYEVHVATMPGEAAAYIRSHGLQHHAVPMSHSGKNPLQIAATLYSLWRLYRRLQIGRAH